MENPSMLKVSKEMLVFRLNSNLSTIEPEKFIISNCHNTKVAFKIRTNTQKIYSVKPFQGVLLPNEEIEVEIQAKLKSNSDLVNNKHRFKIIGCPVPEEVPQNSLSLFISNITKSLPIEKQDNLTMKVSFIIENCSARNVEIKNDSPNLERQLNIQGNSNLISIFNTGYGQRDLRPNHEELYFSKRGNIIGKIDFPLETKEKINDPFEIETLLQEQENKEASNKQEKEKASPNSLNERNNDKISGSNHENNDNLIKNHDDLLIQKLKKKKKELREISKDIIESQQIDFVDKQKIQQINESKNNDLKIKENESPNNSVSKKDDLIA